MSSVKYICTHCGKRFEAEEKENLECPGCFWSTSVKKEVEAPPAEEKAPKTPEPAASKRAAAFSFNQSPILKKGLWSVVLLLLIVLAGWLGGRLWNSLEASRQKKQEEQAREIRIGDKKTKRSEQPALLLSEAEKTVLDRRAEIPDDRKPSEEEVAALNVRVNVQTGFIEKLPSQAWTVTDYEELISSQEKAYKILLPGSYKRKLKKLFVEKYKPAAQAFSGGDLLNARNGWVESLAFPVYADNLAKHRGVVLTMLKPFIQDTLSKIGAINAALVEQRVRDRERQINESYQEMIAAIEASDWVKAYALIGRLEQEISAFDDPEALAGAPIPYPDVVNRVDDGIRLTLFELLSKPPISVADWEPLRRDLRVKKQVLAVLLPDHIAAVRQTYQQALEAIGNEQWNDALALLRKITDPPELKRDAEEKAVILEKLSKASA